MLAETKSLYKKKYGRDIDEKKDFDYDADGTLWLISGPDTGDVALRAVPSLRRLEDMLSEVKQLFELKYGYDVDMEGQPAASDFDYDRDGTLWLRTRPVSLPVALTPSLCTRLARFASRLECCTLQ